MITAAESSLSISHDGGEPLTKILYQTDSAVSATSTVLLPDNETAAQHNRVCQNEELSDVDESQHVGADVDVEKL